MQNIDKSRYENNKFKEEIETILELCDYAEENDISSSFFDDPVDEAEITSWEQKTGVSIPDEYKEWLRFTRSCKIGGRNVGFWSPNNFQFKYIPDDLIAIGVTSGDGELICFSKESGKFFEFFEGHIDLNFRDFKDVLSEIIKWFKVKLGKADKEMDEFLDEMIRRMKELKERNSKK